MKKNIFFAILLLFAINIQAQTEVSAYAPGANAEGVTYYLPQTVLDVTITVSHISHIPGEFSKYADRYLRLSNVIDKEDSFWEITSIDVEEVGLPDVNKVYTVKLTNSSTAANIQLTNDGILQAINTVVPAVHKEKNTVEQQQPKLNPKNYLTEEILTASSTAKMAELTAKEIYSIRESKNAIIRGQAENMPQDGESLRIVLRGLEEQENALLQLFTGSIDTTTHIYTLRITPTKEDVNSQILFRFSRKFGVLNADDLAGAPIYYSIKDLKTVLPPVESKKKSSTKANGIFYCVPGKAFVTIFNNRETYFEENLSMAQLGNVELLSSQLFNKNKTTKVIFNSATGAVSQIQKEEE